MAQFLREKGYRAFTVKGGYQAWKAAGYPTEPKEVEITATMGDICSQCHEPMADHGWPTV